MKVKIDQALMRAALRRAGIGGAHSPLLGLVRCKAADKSLVLSATNAIVEVELSTACMVEEAGEFVAHCRAFASGVAAMPTGLLTVGLSKAKEPGGPRRVTVSGSSGRKWSLQETTQELPTLHEPAGQRIQLSVELLRRLIERVEFGTANIERTYPEKDGVRIEAVGKTIASATFANNMLLSTEEPFEVTDPWRALIPTGILLPLKDILEEAEQEKAIVSLRVDLQRLYIIGPSTILSTTLPVGEYPPWRLPIDNITTPPLCVLPRLALIESLRALQSSLYDTKEPGVRIVVTKDDLKVMGQGDNTSFTDEIALTTSYVEQDTLFKANVGFLLGLLNAADENPNIRIDDSGNVMLFRTDSGFRSALALMDPNKGL